MADPELHAVIMAGGSGTRFWPLSRRARPKQFLRIGGDDSLLQQTWQRALELVDSPHRILVVTVGRYEELTREQLPELPDDNLLLEPQGRNTAPCIAWAAAVLEARDPDATMVVMPADHAIDSAGGTDGTTGTDGLTGTDGTTGRSGSTGAEDTGDTGGAGFGAAVGAAARAAVRHDALVTFGIPPRYPETGYGYIETGEPLEDAGSEGAGDEGTAGPEGIEVFRVRAFKEKPDLETAEAYVSAGNFYWNSGIFVWTVSRIRRAFEAHLPVAWERAGAMLEAAGDRPAEAEAYGGMPATSIDFGIMEVADDVACVVATFEWSDLGSWAALAELREGDSDGNVATGRLVALDARGNLVHAPGELVALLGVEDLAIVRAGDVLLVMPLERSQEVKALREALRDSELDRYL